MLIPAWDLVIGAERERPVAAEAYDGFMGRYSRLMNGQERWQQVEVPISPALWDVWGRYCEVAGISIGRGIAALIKLEVGAISDGLEELEERGRLLVARAAELDAREREIDRRARRAAPISSSK